MNFGLKEKLFFKKRKVISKIFIFLILIFCGISTQANWSGKLVGQAEYWDGQHPPEKEELVVDIVQKGSYLSFKSSSSLTGDVTGGEYSIRDGKILWANRDLVVGTISKDKILIKFGFMACTFTLEIIKAPGGYRYLDEFDGNTAGFIKMTALLHPQSGDL